MLRDSRCDCGSHSDMREFQIWQRALFRHDRAATDAITNVFRIPPVNSNTGRNDE